MNEQTSQDDKKWLLDKIEKEEDCISVGGLNAPQSFPVDDEFRRQSLLTFREMWIDTPAGNDSRRKALEAAMCVFTFGLPSHEWIGAEAGIEWDNACLCDECAACGD